MWCESVVGIYLLSFEKRREKEILESYQITVRIDSRGNVFNVLTGESVISLDEDDCALIAQGQIVVKIQLHGFGGVLKNFYKFNYIAKEKSTS